MNHQQRLREALQRMGMPAGADDAEALGFLAALPLKERNRLRVELTLPDLRVPEIGELQVRQAAVDDLLTRAFSLRAATIDEEARSVEAVIATEAPVEMYDWRRGELVEEVLLAGGVRLPEQLPLLATHDRWDLDSLLGSARAMRREDGSIVGRLFFAAGDEEAEKAWNKARQGHLTDVSVGYRLIESIEIQPGASAAVAGRKFTAGKRAMRVASSWELKEVSVVPIGADQAAKLRDARTNNKRGSETMDKKLREYLETIGLRAEATEKEAEEFGRGLEGEQRTRADQLRNAKPGDPPADPPPPTNQRSDAPGEPPADPPPTNQRSDPPRDPVAVAREAVAAERERCRQVRELAGEDVPEALRTQAVEEGWDLARCQEEFLAAIRGRRTPEAGGTAFFAAGGTAVHSRSHEADCNVRSLAAGLLIQGGLDPTKCREYDMTNSRMGAAFTEQDADRGDEFMRLSAVDICREAVRIDTGRYVRDPDEAIRAALAGGTLSYVFGTNVYAKLVEGWSDAKDSTIGWCEEEDLPNFLPHEEITLNVDGTPSQHGRGDTASESTVGDAHETYRAYRFSRKATIDELDIINDRLGALMKIPVELGRAFRRMRPNMVYSTLLSNPTLVADGVAVFHAASHGNLGSDALGADALATALTAMANQRFTSAQSKSQDPLAIEGRYLIVPTEMRFAAAQLLNSVALAKTHADADDANYMPVNPVGPQLVRQVTGGDLTLVSDSRVNATGAWNPMTREMVTGSATNWFLSSGGERTIRVLYRRGTGRAPAVRSYVLDKGEWGLGWDMNLDLGSKIIDYRGLYRSTGLGA